VTPEPSVESLARRVAELEGELVRLRPVVEAAREWRESVRGWTFHESHPANRLATAVDALDMP
jgi:hypothetical protein